MIDESHFGALGELLVVLQDSHKVQEEQIINASVLLEKSATDFKEIKYANESIRENLRSQHELIEKFIEAQNSAYNKMDENVSEIVSRTALRIRIRHIYLAAVFIAVVAAISGIYSWKTVEKHFAHKYNMTYQKYDKWISIMKGWEDKGAVITFDHISFPKKYVSGAGEGTLDGKTYQGINLKD
jgi:hypothetical protein